MYSSTIRKLNLVGGNWVVKTIAGLAYSYGGNDGIGSTARFNNPTGVAVDGGGNNIYVTDNLNNTVRWLTPVGTDWGVITVAGVAGSSGSADGTGNVVRFNGPYGIAVGNHTNVYVADSLNSTIRGGTPSFTTPLQLIVQIAWQTPGSTFMLTWNAVDGKTYQVQFNTNLNQTAWITLTNITASSSTGIAYILVGPDPCGFYRIVQQP
jgi:DNA-binding beta-propeller fold protein YncE